MQKWVKILAIFLLGAGTTIFIDTTRFKSPVPTSTKPLEITREATSTSPLTTVSTADNQETALVKRVIDGDTIELSDGRRLRYIGIDTPETVDPRRPIGCYGREASSENKRLVEGKTVRLEKDVSQTDTYGRLLRYVYVGELMVNDYLVRQGFAHASTFPPDVKYTEQFRLAEQEARENNRGLWNGCSLESNTRNTSNTSNTSEKSSASSTPSVASASCVIKGNISSSGEKIYHLPGCGSYDKTVTDESTGERWFCTEEDAQNAGWRKAKNC